MTLERPLLVALALAGLALLALIAVLVIRAATSTARQVSVDPVSDLPVDGARAAAHLSRAISYPTISYQDPSRIDVAAFDGLRAALQEMFPRAHQALAREVVGGSVLYTWKGRDPSRPPVLLMGHLDVVPIEPDTEREWQHPPFSGAIEGGFVWGRGAMDFKLAVVGLLEAVELLLDNGFSPAATVYLAFGHDEETGGRQGARAIVDLLSSRGVRLAYVLDEGQFVTEGIVPGITAPVALIGLAEKGYLSVELVVDGQGGHSSTPPRPTPVGILAGAIVRLESKPRPARLEGPTRLMFEALGAELSVVPRIVFANLWLLSGVAERQLAKDTVTDALLRTTTAPTMLEGSVKENVLPRRARAVVNFRLAPGDSVDAVLAHVKRVIGDDRVAARPLEGTREEPSPVSRVTSPGYRVIERTIREVFPGAIVAPALVLGATDGRHYVRIAGDVYRFSPQRLSAEDRSRFHGTNERVSVQNLAECVRFYAQLLRRSADDR